MVTTFPLGRFSTLMGSAPFFEPCTSHMFVPRLKCSFFVSNLLTKMPPPSKKEGKEGGRLERSADKKRSNAKAHREQVKEGDDALPSVHPDKKAVREGKSNGGGETNLIRAAKAKDLRLRGSLLGKVWAAEEVKKLLEVSVLAVVARGGVHHRLTAFHIAIQQNETLTSPSPAPLPSHFLLTAHTAPPPATQ
jgi:hypothetical protein